MSRFYEHNEFSRCALPLFSTTFNRNCTLSQTLFNTDGLTRLHSRLILSLRPSIKATGVAYTFYFKWHHRKESQGVKSGERGGHSTGTPSNPIYGPLIIQIRSHTR